VLILADPICLNLSAVVFSHETVFFSHNKSASAAAFFQPAEPSHFIMTYVDSLDRNFGD
jgi:hypothetical protein